MKTLYIMLMLMLIPGATALNSSDNSTENQTVRLAYTGIVLNASDYVQYKFSDTETKPTLQMGEYTIDYQDINSVLKGAKYQGGIFINPEQPVQVEYEEKLVATTGLDPTTQAAISAITGAGAAYLVVRRKKAA